MNTPPATRLGLGIVLAYGAPSFASVAIAIVMGIHLPVFYSDTVLVPLGAIALVKAVVRAFDAVTDLPTGWLSDRTRTRWGRRRPWIAVGAPIAGVAFWLLFSPPAGLEGTAAIGWLGVTYALFYLGHTAYIIPHYGLGAELTEDYHERSRIFGWREGFVIMGTLVAAIVPPLLSEVLGGERAAFAAFGSVTALALVLLYWNLVAHVRERSDYVERPANPLVPGIRRALRNRVFRIVLAVHVVQAITAGIPPVIAPYFIKYVLMPENPGALLGLYLAAYFGSGLLTLPGWLRLARVKGKRFAWLASMVPGFFGLLGMMFLGPGDQDIAIGLAVLAGSGFGPAVFLVQSILADVIDYDELHTGLRREAQYTAFWSFLQKFAVIPSASIPLAVLGAAGFVPNVVQTESVQWTIRIIFGAAPAVIAVVAFLIALRYPLTQEMHEAIRAGIAAHERGAEAPDPVTGRLLAPPRVGADSEAGWFLDHFSARELALIERKELRQVRLRVVGTALAAVAVCVASALLGFRSFTDWESDPGIATVLWVVVAGVSFSAIVYHGIRTAAAVRLVREPPLPAAVTDHRAFLRGAWAPEAGPGAERDPPTEP